MVHERALQCQAWICGCADIAVDGMLVIEAVMEDIEKCLLVLREELDVQASVESLLPRCQRVYELHGSERWSNIRKFSATLFDGFTDGSCPAEPLRGIIFCVPG